MTSEACCFPRDWIQDIMEVAKANHQTLLLFHVGISNTSQVEDDCRAQWPRVKRWRNVLHPGQQWMHPVFSHFSVYLVARSYRTVWPQDPFQEVGIARDQWYQLNSMGQKCLYQQASWKEVAFTWCSDVIFAFEFAETRWEVHTVALGQGCYWSLGSRLVKSYGWGSDGELSTKHCGSICGQLALLLQIRSNSLGMW